MPERPTAEERFAALVEAQAGGDGVTLSTGKRGFGSNALVVDGRIFAMVSHGCLVLKLPREQVEHLVGSGDGTPFNAGKGRPTREWIALEERAHGRALELAREARAFVCGPGQNR